LSKDLPIQKKEVRHFTSKDKKKPADFDYLPGDMDNYIGYWHQHAIDKEMLDLYQVDVAEAVYLNGQLYDRSVPGNPIFVYNFPSGRRKFYKPCSEDPKKKFYGNSNASDINGMSQIDLSLGGPLIITKSLKDVMVLRYLGYNAIAPQGENVLLPEYIIEWGRETFGEVILFFDNDGEFYPPKRKSGKGKAATKKYFKKYRLPYIFVPDNYLEKDIADVMLKLGNIEAEILMEELLKKENINDELPAKESG